MPSISHLYFRTAIVFLILGVLVGLQMAMTQDHSVVGAHAHINLLGWVTSAIFGGYYALNPAKAQGRLPVIQYWIYAPSVAVLSVALYFMLRGNMALEPVVAISSLVVLLGIVLFAVVVFAKSEARVSLTPGAAAG